ncbi:MAG: 8-oxoguanine DNA glycosylase [Clostridia bacterium]|nr:8-oxoguanine DNA glycosylase [Clostridia bacterium]
MENIIKIEFDSEFFNVKDTLECGQVFRFIPYKLGYKVFTLNKCCYCYNTDNLAVIECLDKDVEYFKNYFDLSRDYSAIYNSALKETDILSKSAKLGMGIRLLNQDPAETLFSFIVSQNNNIPRIKGIIEKLCASLGEKSTQFNDTYYTFPTISRMAKENEEFYKSIGLGYRAEYIRRLAVDIANGLNLADFVTLDTPSLKRRLLGIFGVGPKVADCVLLFGFKRSDSFPVDTWIEKVYKENFKGELKNREKISKYFTDRFKENSGYYQQYLFYYKRSLEKEN